MANFSLINFSTGDIICGLIPPRVPLHASCYIQPTKKRSTTTKVSQKISLTMSKEYEGQDPMAIARQAERDLNSHQAKHGVSTTDSSRHLCSLPHH